VITIIFWNINKRPDILDHIECLGQTHLVDVFILSECPKNVKPALRALNVLGVGTYREEVSAKAKVRALTRLPAGDFIHRFTSIGREMAVWSVSAPKLTPDEVLIAGVHLPSKAGGIKDTDQDSVVGEVIEELGDVEDIHRHRNTVFVGDFNMHPYDPGMTSVTRVHGLMTRKLAELPDRVHRRQQRRRFYNPMWGLFGDRTPGPAGSYYWRSSALHNPHWGIFDQVLIRPALIDHLKDLHILDHDGNDSLVGPDDAPDRKYLSDHLPVLFRLDI
jgi:exonuclease III